MHDFRFASWIEEVEAAIAQLGSYSSKYVPLKADSLA